MKEKSNTHIFILIIVLISILAVLFLFANYFSVGEKPEKGRADSPRVEENTGSSSEAVTDKEPTELEQVRSLKGVIKTVDTENGQMTVSFNHKGDTWTSKIDITEETRLGGFNKSDDGLPPDLSISDFKEEEEVIVSASENLLNVEEEILEANSVVKAK